MATSEREFQIVVYGATGFVGALTARHLAVHGPDGVRIALAGRSRAKLESVRDTLGDRAADWPVLVADAGDADALAALARRTYVVASTVGPYLSYGLPLVQACVEAGTHYADLTGELLFVRTVIDRHHGAAAAAGTKIVNSCGFDSVPSDLGVLALHEAVQQAGAGELTDTALVLGRVRGGFSGGTIASLLGQVQEMKSSKSARTLVADPYALSPDAASEPQFGRQLDVPVGLREKVSGEFQAPFVMAAYNTRVVRRSNALLDHAYGARFRYSEVMGFGSSPAGAAKAIAMTGALGIGAAALVASPRPLLDKVLPSPGEGPSETMQEKGFFAAAIHGRTTTGAHFVTHFEAQGDPGYAATAVMLGQSALALALDDVPDVGGVLTPATGIGMTLADRLRDQGFRIETEVLPG